ncbi:MAG: hypothetical protein OEV92_09720 [Nitrospinota bacterium]|nr:hypothetical protein [Nitrospinota bacterium]
MRGIMIFALAAFLISGWAGQAQAAASNADRMFREARSAYGSADYSKTIKICDDIIKMDAKYADAYALRGKAKKDMGDVDAATSDLDKATQLNPGLAEAFYIRGQVQEIMGEMEKAKADYAKACAGGYKDACK